MLSSPSTMADIIINTIIIRISMLCYLVYVITCNCMILYDITLHHIDSQGGETAVV